MKSDLLEVLDKHFNQTAVYLEEHLVDFLQLKEAASKQILIVCKEKDAFNALFSDFFAKHSKKLAKF